MLAVYLEEFAIGVLHLTLVYKFMNFTPILLANPSTHISGYQRPICISTQRGEGGGEGTVQLCHVLWNGTEIVFVKASLSPALCRFHVASPPTRRQKVLFHLCGGLCGPLMGTNTGNGTA